MTDEQGLLILRTKPVIVQARQLTDTNQLTIARWVRGWTHGVREVKWFDGDGHVATAGIGDWIVKNSNARFRRMSEQTMFSMYEKVVS